jgi:hypothetical protein
MTHWRLAWHLHSCKGTAACCIALRDIIILSYCIAYIFNKLNSSAGGIERQYCKLRLPQYSLSFMSIPSRWHGVSVILWLPFALIANPAAALVTPGIQTRYASLHPWGTFSSKPLIAQDDASTIITLGHVYETRHADTCRHQVTVHVPTTAITNLHERPPLTFALPYFATADSLASSLWPTSLATAILMLQAPPAVWTSSSATTATTTTATATSSKDESSPSKPLRILEVGAGLGLTGLSAAAAAHYATTLSANNNADTPSSTQQQQQSPSAVECVLTDYDRSVLEQLQDVLDNPPTTTAAPHPPTRVEWLDWREPYPIDRLGTFTMVVSSEVAYYYHLLRPLMDTVRHATTSDCTWIVAGQANRECQWTLYHNLRDGCYNQITDEREGPWPGTTRMLLYQLRVHAWQYNDTAARMEPNAPHDTSMDADPDQNAAQTGPVESVIPFAVLVYQSTSSQNDDTSGFFSPHDHVATPHDESLMEFSF